MTREQVLDRYKGFVYNLTQHELGEIHPHLLHMVLGVVTEAGELADAVKQMIGYRRIFDGVNAKEEIGDLLFYVQGMCNFMGWEITDIMKENMYKLNKRYPDGFTEKDAIERKDKKDEHVD